MDIFDIHTTIPWQSWRQPFCICHIPQWPPCRCNLFGNREHVVKISHFYHIISCHVVIQVIQRAHTHTHLKRFAAHCLENGLVHLIWIEFVSCILTLTHKQSERDRKDCLIAIVTYCFFPFFWPLVWCFFLLLLPF